MTWRTLTAAVSVLFLTGALAWANVCPLCLTSFARNVLIEHIERLY